MNFNFGNLISAAAGAVSSVASAVEGTVSSVASAVDGEISEVASAVSSKLGGIAGAVLGTMSAIASVSEDGNIDDEDMEDMLTEVYKLLVGANIVSFGSDSTSDSDDLSNKAKSLFDEVTGIGRDFIIGTGHSVDRDIFFGVEGINDSDMPNTTSYKVGSAFGDVLSIFAGESEMTVGGGGEVIGVALDGTVVLSPAGVAANVASAGLFVHGGHTMYEGASNLGKDLASFSSADGGGGEAESETETASKLPIQQNEITTYKDFQDRSVVGDNLEGHEVWQHANLKANDLATNRLSTEASKNNPVIALEREQHKIINKAQKAIDAPNQLPLDNIMDNSKILRDAGIPEDIVNDITNRALNHMKNTLK
jgi:hypothetical protein